MPEEYKYDVRWQRQKYEGTPDGEIMECKNLDTRTFFSRLIKAINNSGPIIIHSIKKSNIK